MPTNLSPEMMLDLVLNALPVGLFWKDRDSRILGCNKKFAEDSGVTDPADLFGKTNFDLYPAEEAEFYRADDLEVITTGLPKLGIEEPLLLATGETAWVETNKVPIRNAVGEVVGVLGTYRDVTEHRRSVDERIRLALELVAAKQAATLAMHDTLTSLPNRRYLEEELRARLLETRLGEQLAVVALDLDRFKTINDLYGHSAGDELLRQVASLLKEAAGENGFVARRGGDNFIMLLGYEFDPSLLERLSTLLAMFEAPICLTGYEVLVGATLGVAVSPADGIDSDHLMRRADIAMCRAKEQGRSRVVFFEPGMDLVMEDRIHLERDLRFAVKNDGIVPYFQPLVELGTGEVSGYEVLARWPHSERGLVQPGQFIDIAENAGLITELTTNLLRRACREVSGWPGTPRISINISPIQLHDASLPQKLLSVLMECGFPPARLEIEITENALIANFDAAKAILTALNNQGIRIALDDFGTGYSSLQHLSKLPFDILKIDRSFVRAINDGEDGLSIVMAIVHLAKSLRLSVTAEGIETEGQFLALRALGCERGQGFFLGRPSPLYSEDPASLQAGNKAAVRAMAS